MANMSCKDRKEKLGTLLITRRSRFIKLTGLQTEGCGMKEDDLAEFYCHLQKCSKGNCPVTKLTENIEKGGFK